MTPLPSSLRATFRPALIALLVLLALSVLSCSGEDTANRQTPDLDVGLDADDAGDVTLPSTREPRVIEGATQIPRPGDTVLPCPPEGCPACEVNADCDDGIACTEDVCDTEAGECVVSTAHTRCDDGLFCNGYEMCAPEDPQAAESGCVAGEPPVLADGVSCTLDVCDEENDQIVHQGDDARCESDEPCAVSICDPVEGCVTEPAEDGTLCMDDTMVCQGGDCIPCIDDAEGSADSGCSGGEPFCVDGACAQCEDSADCPMGLICDAGVCTGCTTSEQCDDGASCTVEGCFEGSCLYYPLPSVCGRGDACATRAPSCSPRDAQADADGCVPGPSKLDDLEPITCVERSCDPATGAITESLNQEQCEPSGPCVTSICTTSGCEEEPLNAGIACLYGETEMEEGFCDGQGSCAVCADTVVGGIDAGCDALNPSCVEGSCTTCTDEGPGCPRDCNGELDGPAYEDACGQCDADITNDCANVCDGGACSPCEIDADCNDRNACTLDQCVEGYCNNDPAPLDGDTCQSSEINVCVTSYSCQEGSCQRDGTVTCDGPCHTGGACREGIGGCEIDVGASCDDGDPSTINDTCSPWGQCVGECAGPDGQLCAEDDGNPCTVPACDGEGGCTERITPGVSCEMACGAGVCSTEGVCEPVDNVCNPESMRSCAAFECRPDEGGCVVVNGDPKCELDGASCVSALGLCSAGSCGDGFCDIDAEYRNNANHCFEDCVREGCGTSPTSYLSCDEPLNNEAVLGTWNSAMSIAYGIPELDARQTETIRRQLEDGVEWLHFIVDYCSPGASSGPICVCKDDDTCGLASTPLRDRLAEVRDYLLSHPARIVQLYVRSYLERGDLREVIDQAGLSELLYRRALTTAGFSTLEPFAAARAQLIASNQRLVIYDRDFVPPFNIFLGDSRRYEVVDGIPRTPPPTIVFSGQETHTTNTFNCVTSTNIGPSEAIVSPPIYGVVHNAGQGSSTFVGAACWNRYVQNHLFACQEEEGRRPNVIFVNYYNADPEPLDWARVDNDIVSACPEVQPDTCRQDSDCDAGVCNLFGVCVSCTDNADCRDDQYCNGWFNACFADLPGGGLCTEPEECASGVCSLFTCTGCEQDSDCQEDQFCAFDGTCSPKKAIGEGCINAQECVSNTCYLGYCTECDEQSDCGDGTFCSLNPLPGESACIPPKPNGETCAQTFECESGNCFAGFCVACDAQSDCADPNQFCSLDPLPGQSACIDRKPNGQACAQDLECASDSCYLGFCAGCNEQSDCPDANTFCSLDPLPGASACIPLKSNGQACAQNMECASDSCYLGFCVECNEQSDCPASNEFCSLDPAPGASACIARKANGSVCAQGFECTSGQCTAFVCGECASDANCSANEHCDALNNCAPDVGNGAPCLKDSACTTDLCLDGFCAQCRNDSECPASQHCDAFNNCVNDVPNGSACLRDSACTTDLCLAGFCAQCENDSQCPASQHCDAFNNCVNDVGNNAPCLRDANCSTGICSAGFCAQCTFDGHCSSNQFCNVFGDCENKVPNGSLCADSRVCQSNCCSFGFCSNC
ncbi:hypothetical protein FRC96_12225 [Lujinxingia vulgaris]|uniref:Uncharacterized protein n=1 Tax=Lujinxingia vulgaris TaxID=2600176 RepID=A0A5C6XBS9_9DELT|nr:hypothetical protein [Lujinxingia vulgaris]TXD34819.1 hypothetical protein FRC96_12225 [Lujinxingia vulgaris]